MCCPWLVQAYTLDGQPQEALKVWREQLNDGRTVLNFWAYWRAVQAAQAADDDATVAE